MNIHYHLSGYISHRRAGEAYIDCLGALGHTLVRDPATSDLVILHDEPHWYPALMRNMPRAPGRRFVGYGVWETPQLPKAFIDGVRAVDAVWTCSEFSRQAFLPHVPAYLLPHVVARRKVSREDMAWAVERTGRAAAGRDVVFFYTIADAVNPRKNLETLLAAFGAAFPREAAAVRLVVKQYREPRNLGTFPRVVNIPETLTDGQIAALHAVCDVYVSAHHAEAWGLPLSEALRFGNPVIATGYSGNMEFMTPENSFPIPYTIAPVPEAMCLALPGIFSTDMTWADIDVPGLIHALRRLAARPVSAEFRTRAAASMEAFSPAAVAERLGLLLKDA